MSKITKFYDRMVAAEDNFFASFNGMNAVQKTGLFIGGAILALAIPLAADFTLNSAVNSAINNEDVSSEIATKNSMQVVQSNNDINVQWDGLIP